MPRSRFNEGMALDAVIRVIEARDSAQRLNDGWSPDDQDFADKARRVEYVVTIGAQLYAFEHTGIEPFGDHIEMSVHNAALFKPVEERFDGKRSDAEFWELYVPVVASAGLTRAKVKQVQLALIRWIETTAMSFPLTQYGGQLSNRAMNETINGVPFRVSLHRWSLDGIGATNSPLCGRFSIKYFVENDVEIARLGRLQKVCEDKFPKLASWRRNDNARTILVLEENDISLTNHQVVADAMALAEAGVADPPDEIFLVSTHSANLWWVTCLRRPGRTYYDEGERFHEFDPMNLKKLTLR